MTTDEIVGRLRNLAPGPEWVVLTGGNPLLHELGDLVASLHKHKYMVSIETQGAKFRNWVMDCDSICISPKPPSAMLDRRRTEINLDTFMTQMLPRRGGMFFKVVIFDQVDYDWARALHTKYIAVPMFLSAGNDAGKTVGNPNRKDERSLDQVVRDLLSRTRWLTNYTMVDPTMRDVRVQSQQHVLLWGNERGH